MRFETNYVPPYMTTRSLETFLGTLMFVCGAILIHPDSTFSLPHYSMAKAYLSEELGGIVLALIGVIRLGALIYNGRKRQSPLARLAGCCVGAGFWLTMSFAFIEALAVEHLEPIPLMLGVSGCAFVFEVFSGMRCGADASHLDSFGLRDKKARAGDAGSAA